MDLVDEPQAVEVLVEQEHFGFHALRDPRRVPADVAGAEHDDTRRAHSGRAAEQHTASTVVAFEEVRADLGRHPAGDLAHRREQRERARLELHRLVRDAGHAVLEQGVGDVRIRREVEVREQHETGTQPRELVGLGLLHLQHELGALPQLGGSRDHVRRRRAR